MSSSPSPAPSAAARLAALSLPGTVHLGRAVADAEPARRLPTGVAGLDVILGGGLPRGRISEIAGGRSCGKTALLSACLASATRRGEAVACIDLPGSLHPESWRGAGVDLGRLLWVRPAAAVMAVRCAELLLRAGGFGVVALDFGDERPVRLPASTWLRLARASEAARSVLLILTPQRLAGGRSAAGLELERRRARWLPGRWALLDGFEVSAHLARHVSGPAAPAAIAFGAASVG